MLITPTFTILVGQNLKSTTMELPFAESWKIKMVEPIRKSTREEREHITMSSNSNQNKFISTLSLIPEQEL